MIARNWAELLYSVKHLLRDGMPNASEAEINALLESAQHELLHNTYHAYYKMYPARKMKLTSALRSGHSVHTPFEQMA
jgi:hypothetical protein